VESGVVYEAGLKRDYDIKIDIPKKEKIFGVHSEIDFGESTL